MTLGLDNVSPEEGIEACELAQANEFINELPLRYSTMLDENGENLSGGQRQRLAIARALLRKPEILILDEATSNLDTVTERALEHTLNVVSADMTVIFIAHRLSLVKNCNQIFVMDKGRVIENGTHSELKRAGGTYARLVRQQDLTANSNNLSLKEEKQFA